MKTMRNRNHAKTARERDRFRISRLRPRLRVFGVLALGPGCTGESAVTEGRPNDPEPTIEASSAPDRNIALLTDRIWWRIDEEAPPGELRVFLSDGTMLMDSCGEVYRLARWEARGDSAIGWSEDGMGIAADVVVASDERLELRLHLVAGPEIQAFEPAQSPYVCPELPR